MSCDAKDGQIPESTSTPPDPLEAGQSAALGKMDDIPAKSSIIERFYSPSTKQAFACKRDDPSDNLQIWLELHPDAIRLIPEISGLEIHSNAELRAMGYQMRELGDPRWVDLVIASQK